MSSPNEIPTDSRCPSCGIIKKSKKLSCCAPGGTWFKKCGNVGDSEFKYTWTEGLEACATGERLI